MQYKMVSTVINAKVCQQCHINGDGCGSEGWAVEVEVEGGSEKTALTKTSFVTIRPLKSTTAALRRNSNASILRHLHK